MQLMHVVECMFFLNHNFLLRKNDGSMTRVKLKMNKMNQKVKCDSFSIPSFIVLISFYHYMLLGSYNSQKIKTVSYENIKKKNKLMAK